MKNGNTPAMPNNLDIDTFSEFSSDFDIHDFEMARAGLTKREHFAGLAMQARLQDITPNSWGEPEYYKQIAKQAVNHADALLAELDKVKA